MIKILKHSNPKHEIILPHWELPHLLTFQLMHTVRILGIGFVISLGKPSS